MNIRKTLLLILVIAIASLGLTLIGCEKHDHPTGDHPAAKEAAKTCCGADPSKCCGSKAVEEAAKEAADVKEAVEGAAEDVAKEAADVKEAVKEAAAEHPTEHPK